MRTVCCRPRPEQDIRDIPLFQSDVPDDRVECPHCGRKFAELVAERHIPKCSDIKAKPNFLGAGAGRGAHMRNGAAPAGRGGAARRF